MSVKLEIINPLNNKKWDDLILSTKNYSFFHSSIWTKVLYESYHYNPCYFMLSNNDNILALIPLMDVKSFFTGRRGVSLPFSDYCEPIISQKIYFQYLLKNIIQYGKRIGWKFFELRVGENLYQNLPSIESYLIHFLDLTQNENFLFLNFRKSTQRNIKKSIREKVTVNKCNSLPALKEFYRLHCMTRKLHGLLPQPYFFFKNIFDYIISKEHGYIFLASYLGKSIAGAIFFQFGKTSIYKYAASDRKFQNLRANNLIIWEAVKWYTQNGYESLSFGRTELNNKGLMQFKDGWGAKKQKIKYIKYNLKKNTIKEWLRVFTIYNGVFKKIPIPFARVLSSLLYKEIG